MKRYFAGRGRVGDDPAAFGRLCVETVIKLRSSHHPKPSRLRAAVC